MGSSDLRNMPLLQWVRRNWGKVGWGAEVVDSMITLVFTVNWDRTTGQLWADGWHHLTYIFKGNTFDPMVKTDEGEQKWNEWPICSSVAIICVTDVCWIRGTGEVTENGCILSIIWRMYRLLKDCGVLWNLCILSQEVPGSIGSWENIFTIRSSKSSEALVFY